MYRLLICVPNRCTGRSLFVGWHESRCHLIGVALLSFDVRLALVCGVPGFSVGHSEEVVRVDAAVGAGVPRDWCAQLLALLLCVHAEELVHCLELALCGGSLLRLLFSSQERVSSFGVSFGAPEFVHRLGVDGPRISVLSARDTDNLGNGRWAAL